MNLKQSAKKAKELKPAQSVEVVSNDLPADLKDKEKIKLQDFERRYEALETEPEYLESIMPTRVATAMRAIPADIKDMPQDLLEKKVTASFDARMMRQAFWMEFDRVSRTKSKQFILGNVYNGLMHQKNFYREWVDNSFRLEYLLRPPTELQVVWEELLYTSTANVRSMLEMSQVDDNGKPNAKVMELQLKAFMYLSDRRRGHVLGNARLEGVAQKAQMQVNLAIQQNQQSSPVVEDRTEDLDLDSIEARIAELEGRALPAPADDIITTTKVVSYEKEKA